MGLHRGDIPDDVLEVLHRGTVIPAHPLALDAERNLDPRRQRALARYYLDAGAGGLAVGVHATQFAIREAGLFDLEIVAIEGRVELELQELARANHRVDEARRAVSLGYHAGLLSLAAMKGASEEELITHCRHVADEMPLIGFYLQPAVGGIGLDASFWRRFAEIDNVVAIKAAPFNRYATLDVLRGVVVAGAEGRIAVYTGNDDHIVPDLLTPFAVTRNGEEVRVRVRGGLLGHWSVWTKRAVELLGRIHAAIARDRVDADLLAMDAKVTDCNSAVFDVANGFAGCLPGCHEVLRRQGLLAGTWCLDPAETLSPGQAAEIERVMAEHGELTDDEFVSENLERWLAD